MLWADSSTSRICASRSSACVAMANMAALAVVASKTRMTAWFSGSRRARASIRGAAGLGPGLLRNGVVVSGPVVESGEHRVGSVELIAGPGEVPADRVEFGAPVDAVSQEPGGLLMVRVRAGARVKAQLGLEFLGDRAGLDEADQAPGEVLFLWPGGQPDGQPPGGDVIDDGAPAVSVRDAVVDQALVKGQVW